MGYTFAATLTKISFAISSSGPFNAVIKLRQPSPSRVFTLFYRLDVVHGRCSDVCPQAFGRRCFNANDLPFVHKYIYIHKFIYLAYSLHN
jgi:hypothetical protein